MGGKYSEIPSPALPGSGSKGMISARNFGHPRLRPFVSSIYANIMPLAVQVNLNKLCISGLLGVNLHFISSNVWFSDSHVWRRSKKKPAERAGFFA